LRARVAALLTDVPLCLARMEGTRITTASLSSSGAGRVRLNARRCFACWNVQVKRAS
jgi:hypothetical protein